jgi:hypothetical protein
MDHTDDTRNSGQDDAMYETPDKGEPSESVGAAPAPESTSQVLQLQEAQQTPVLQLTAGNAAASDAAPRQPEDRTTQISDESKSKGKAQADTSSSGKASRKREGGKSKETDPEAESKPGIKFTGKAVVDRFEGAWAVLLVGDDEKSVSVPRKSLPRRVQAGQWLNVQLGGDDGDEVVSAKVDPEETARMRKRILDKLARLRSGSYLTEDTEKQPPQS